MNESISFLSVGALVNLRVVVVVLTVDWACFGAELKISFFLIIEMVISMISVVRLIIERVILIVFNFIQVWERIQFWTNLLGQEAQRFLASLIEGLHLGEVCLMEHWIY